jgi:hypothetical protein
VLHFFFYLWVVTTRILFFRSADTEEKQEAVRARFAGMAAMIASFSTTAAGRADTDGDGMISFEEFCDFLRQQGM